MLTSKAKLLHMFWTSFFVFYVSIYVWSTGIEVLALTHENATAEERMPYLSWLFNPVPVHNLVGRSANMSPPCKKHECVWFAWKDCFFFCQISRAVNQT